MLFSDLDGFLTVKNSETKFATAHGGQRVVRGEMEWARVTPAWAISVVSILAGFLTAKNSEAKFATPAVGNFGDQYFGRVFDHKKHGAERVKRASGNFVVQ